MANKVLLKKSSVAAKVPLVTDLDYGELAVNYADGKLYYKTTTNTISAFTTNVGTVTSVSGTGSVSGLTLTGTVTSSGNLTLGGTLSLTSTQITTGLGFTPVQQGGGTGQSTNKLYVGWLGSQLGLQVDVTNFGSTWPIGVTGNSATATKLATARNINGVAFDGTANINIATKLVILNRAAASINVAIANGLLGITNRAGSTINVAVS